MPVVEVRDQDRHPVAGLSVTFAAPSSGPHVTFANGSSTYSTVTDTNGRATVPTMTPVGQGEFKINVSADLSGPDRHSRHLPNQLLDGCGSEAGRGWRG